MNLFDRFKVLIPNNNKFVVGIPITKNHVKSPNSTSFDLIFTKIDQKGELEVYTFDFTVGKKKITTGEAGGKL